MAESRQEEIHLSHPDTSNEDTEMHELRDLTGQQNVSGTIDQSTTAIQEPEKIRSNLKIAAIMIALLLSLFVAALDQTIVATAIPTICSELNSASGYTWIGGAYLLADAAASPIWAKLSDIWGRKPILLASVALFFVASIICARAVNMNMLIAGRALQGTASGGVMQLVNITISDLFSMRTRSLYLGSLEIMWAIAGGIGPVIGGALTEYVSWRYNFWIDLPISGTSFLLLLFFLDVHNPRTKMSDGFKAIDWFGGLSILALTLMLLLGLEFGGVTFPWSSPKVICLIVFGSLMSIFFIFSEKRLARYPVMPLSIFRKASNSGSLALCFVHGFVFIASEYYLPLFFQSVMEASPLRSGVCVITITVCEASMGIISGIIISKTGRYLELIWAGVILLTIGNGLYVNLSATSPVAQAIGFQVVAGLGAGLLFMPPMIALQAGVSQEDTATATATFGFIRNVATSMSIVIGGVVFQNGMQLQAPELRASGLPTNITDQLLGGDAAANVMVIRRISDPTQRLIVKQAFAWSLRNMWIMYCCMAACGIIATAFIRKQHLQKEHTETKTGLKKEGEIEAAAVLT